ncbi:DUF2240 family protein [Candidatus Woesearchaeota archaeon]|nr:DUF2240 family protein [Candidatus Woesearchaeota archaeon]
MPTSQIIDKIISETDLTETEIKGRIQQKLDALSGLISEEGAAHIVANELSIKLFDAGGRLQIKNILSGMRSVETIGKVTNIFEIREFENARGKGKVANIIIGDETGRIRIAIWGSKADKIKELKENDIVKIKNGYVRENQGRKEVHLNDNSELTINPSDETIGEVLQTPGFGYTRKNINELKNDDNVEIMGFIVQAFEPRFYEVCPQCSKKLKNKEETLVCDEHGIVTPDYSYVLNFQVDDGTDIIRAVAFRQQTQKLLDKTHEQVLILREKLENFESIKKELLGEQVKLVGRAQQNNMFDRLEFVTQLVFAKPSPEDEIKRLEQ